MDESAQTVFKMKFAKLTLVLNAIIMLAAVSIISFFGLIPFYSLQIAILCAIGALVLAVYFRGAYMKEKAWLEEQDN